MYSRFSKDKPANRDRPIYPRHFIYSLEFKNTSATFLWVQWMNVTPGILINLLQWPFLCYSKMRCPRNETAIWSIGRRIEFSKQDVLAAPESDFRIILYYKGVAWMCRASLLIVKIHWVTVLTQSILFEHRRAQFYSIHCFLIWSSLILLNAFRME